jgi:predicted PurR-regulated permease PerM
MNGRHTFYHTLIVAFTLLGLFLVWRLAEIVVVVFGAIVFASAVRPFVKRLTEWRLPMGLAILVAYLLIFGFLGGLFAVAVPPLFAVARDLVQDTGLIFRTAASLYGWISSLGYTEIAGQLFTRIFEEWNALQSRVEAIAVTQGPPILMSVAEGLAQLVLAFVVAFYWLTARDQIQNLMLSLTPVRTRGRVEMIWNDVERTMGDWVRATALCMLSIGVSAFIGLVILGVPYALPLALIAGLFEALPMVGATLGALPAILIGFTVSPTVGVLTILLFVLIQSMENYILVPRLMSQNVGLSPLIVIIAIVAGGMLNGIVGALFAIPVAAALQVIVRALLVEPMIEEASESRLEDGVPVFIVQEEESKPGEIILPRASGGGAASNV